MKKTVVVGIGNLIRGDDAIGIRLARCLSQVLPPHFEIKELATTGLDLAAAITGYDRVVLLDAIQTPQGEPGQIHYLALDDSPRSLNLSSSHGLGLAQAVELAKQLGPAQPQIEIIAIEAPQVDQFCEGLSPQLEEKLTALAATIKAHLMPAR